MLRKEGQRNQRTGDRGQPPEGGLLCVAERALAVVDFPHIAHDLDQACAGAEFQLMGAGPRFGRAGPLHIGGTPRAADQRPGKDQPVREQREIR